MQRSWNEDLKCKHNSPGESDKSLEMLCFKCYWKLLNVKNSGEIEDEKSLKINLNSEEVKLSLQSN